MLRKSTTPLVSGRKGQIRGVAETLFRRKGYKAASMRGLADQLGMEAASLYHHVRSKEEILHDICFTLAADFFRAQEQVPPDAGSETKLRAAILFHLGVMETREDAFLVYLHDWQYLSEPHRSEFRKLRKRYEAFFDELVNEGIRRKEFRPLDARWVTQILLTSINAGFDWSRPARMQREAFSDQLMQLFFKGLSRGKTGADKN